MTTNLNLNLEQVRVSKGRLLEAVKENREKHRIAYDEALQAFTQAYLKLAETALKELRKGTRDAINIYLPKPVSHISDYDRIIDLLEYSLDSQFEISIREFAQYVRDEWSWTQEFLANVSSYAVINHG